MIGVKLCTLDKMLDLLGRSVPSDVNKVKISNAGRSAAAFNRAQKVAGVSWSETRRLLRATDAAPDGLQTNDFQYFSFVQNEWQTVLAVEPAAGVIVKRMDCLKEKMSIPPVATSPHLSGTALLKSSKGTARLPMVSKLMVRIG